MLVDSAIEDEDEDGFTTGDNGDLSDGSASAASASALRS